MDAIKKKMQTMKVDKDNAATKAEKLENDAKEANARADKTEEEVRANQKKVQQIENDLDQVQEQLMQTNSKWDEKEKAFQNVSKCYFCRFFFLCKEKKIQTSHHTTTCHHANMRIKCYT
jgi:tropomyosin-1